jgi:P27 family predicted phage terminase small subunit
MATGGKAPTPKVLALVTGSKKAKVLKPGAVTLVDEDEIKALVRPPPAWFTAEHKAEWDYYLANVPPGLLKSIDFNTFTRYISAVVEYNRAAMALRTAPMLDTTPNGFEQPSAYYSILNRQAEISLRCAVEMGFTPSSRARVVPGVGKPNKAKAKDDPKKEFFG